MTLRKSANGLPKTKSTINLYVLSWIKVILLQTRCKSELYRVELRAKGKIELDKKLSTAIAVALYE